METIKELYQEVILDHNRNPRNFKKLANATHTAVGDNPLCGDHIDLFLVIDNEVIKDIGFTGKGCAISKSSASLMTSELKGKTIEQAKDIFNKFHDFITSESIEINTLDKFGKMIVFEGVKQFPIRIKCASLAWHTLISAIKNGDKITTTE